MSFCNCVCVCACGNVPVWRWSDSVTAGGSTGTTRCTTLRPTRRRRRGRQRWTRSSARFSTSSPTKPAPLRRLHTTLDPCVVVFLQLRTTVGAVDAAAAFSLCCVHVQSVCCSLEGWVLGWNGPAPFPGSLSRALSILTAIFQVNLG